LFAINYGRIEALTWVVCEDLLHILHKKICTHKTHLRMELLCSCILTSKGGSM
jgi:hypothetical protein